MIKTVPFLPKIAIITPGYKPVPDVSGGAVEHLVTQIIEQNEVSPHFYFELYSIYDIKLSDVHFKYTHITFVKNWRKNFFLHGFGFAVNRIFRLLKSNRRFNPMAIEVAKKLQNDVCAVIVENDMDVLRQIRRKIAKLPIVFHMHNDFDTFAERQKTAHSMEWTVKNTNEIWAVSNYLTRHILSVFPNATVKTFSNCIDRKRFSPEAVEKDAVFAFRTKYGIPEDNFVILYSGRIIVQKGVYELLAAVSLLPTDVKLKLVIVGDLDSGYKDYLDAVKKSAFSIQNRVVLAGYVPQYEMQTAYAVADIVVIPSQCQEAYCLSAIEAISMGKPVVASAGGGMLDFLDSTCAILVPLGSGYVKKISEAIYRLYSDKILRSEMGINARKKSLLCFDERQYFDRFITLMNAFISQSKEEQL